MVRLRRKKPLFFLVIIILVGMVISFFGIYFVSQHKRAREINLKKSLTDLVLDAQQKIENQVLLDFNKIYQSLSNITYSNETWVEELVRILDSGKKFIKYPFIINTKKTLLFPAEKQAVLPLDENPNEHQTYKDIIERNSYQAQNVERKYPSIFSNFQAQYFYNKGIDSEFKKGDFEEALKYYKKGDFWNKNKKAQVIFYNGMARCLSKQGDFKKALTIYLMIRYRLSHYLKGDFEYLKIRILRQISLISPFTEYRYKTIEFYLSLYEEILKLNKNGKPGIFVFFKAEALDYLNSLSQSSFPKNSRKKFRDLRERDLLTRDHSLEDQIQDVYSNIKGDSTNRRDIIQKELKKIFVHFQEEVLFYHTLDTLVDWDAYKTSELMVIEPKTENPKDKYSLCYKKVFSNPIKREPDPIFGFIFNQETTDQGFVLRKINSTISQEGLKIQFKKDSIDPEFTHEVLSVGFKKYFHSNPLLLFSRRADHIGKKVTKEIWINYTLMGLLIMTFIFFIVLFYKYISREAELLRLKSDFVDSVTHTLKTPLTRISLLAENVARNWVKGREKKQEFLNTIISESNKMNEMINNMLNFSKIDAEKKQYQFKSDSLMEIVQSVVNNYTEYIERLGFTLKVEIKKNIPQLSLDREGMKLLLINLLQNSIKYSLKKKYIEIQLYKEDNEVVLVVADKGMGIAKGEFKKIFEKYYRTHNKQVKALEGSGLGLFLVKSVVTAHGGEINVRSRVGEGSTFTIRLPIKIVMKDE
jgi:pentatricopeptide repeat protein